MLDRTYSTSVNELWAQRTFINNDSVEQSSDYKYFAT